MTSFKASGSRFFVAVAAVLFLFVSVFGGAPSLGQEETPVQDEGQEETPVQDEGQEETPVQDEGQEETPVQDEGQEQEQREQGEEQERGSDTPNLSGPNVLVIMTDDQRREGTMSVMPRTRNYMRAGGTDFTNAIANNPFCCPSRASLFTGRYTHNHGVEVNMAGDPNRLDHRTTIQRYLQEAGYRTGMLGKYLNGWDLSLSPPYFDEWAIFGASATGYVGGLWNVNRIQQRIYEYSTTYIRDKALEFMESPDPRPWLLFVHPAAPHPPFLVESEFMGAPVPPFKHNAGTKEKDLSDKPRSVRKRQKALKVAKTERRKQLRTLMSVDVLVNDLLQKLEADGAAEDTLVFYLSDNGYLWGEHGITRKMVPYEESVKIPLFMRWPGRVTAGVKDHRMAGIIDVAETIFDATGITPDAPTDGKSLLEQWDRDRILMEFFRAHARPSWAGTRTNKTVYVEYYHRDTGRITFRELYNLKRDPRQTRNLIVRPRPNTKPRLRQHLQTLRQDKACAGESCP